MSPDHQKTIGIFAYLERGISPWDPDSKGLTGSEEAIVYFSKELAKKGHRVFVFGTAPSYSSHARTNPCFIRDLNTFFIPIDVGIVWRMAYLGPQFKRFAKTLHLWPHDILTHPLSQPQIEPFDDVLWLSEWQREQWMSIDPKFARFTHFLGNGINPEQFPLIQERKNPFSCIYGSNYGRGLTVLVEIWPKIKKLFPQATLDIFYGWKHWGALFPDEENMLRQKIPHLSDVKEHGRVSHEELHQAYAQTSLWTYPCTKPEVFCITAIKAQYSGAIPVILKSAALHETVPYGFSCFQVEEYFETLKTAMEHAEKISVSERSKMRDFILNRWTWKKIADQYFERLI